MKRILRILRTIRAEFFAKYAEIFFPFLFGCQLDSVDNKKQFPQLNKNSHDISFSIELFPRFYLHHLADQN